MSSGRWIRNHVPLIHIKENKESKYTLCGLRIFTFTTKGLRIYLTVGMNNKNEHGVCKKCQKAREKLKNNLVEIV